MTPTIDQPPTAILRALKPLLHKSRTPYEALTTLAVWAKQTARAYKKTGKLFAPMPTDGKVPTKKAATKATTSKGIRKVAAGKTKIVKTGPVLLSKQGRAAIKAREKAATSGPRAKPGNGHATSTEPTAQH